MDINELLENIKENNGTRNQTVKKLLTQININNNLISKLLSEKTNIKWQTVAITGQEYNKAYERYIYRYGLGLINENHPYFNKIKIPKPNSKLQRNYTLFRYIKPSNELEIPPDVKIPNENLILCNYGTTISATEKYTYLNNIADYNWLYELLINKKYIEGNSNLSKLNTPEEVALVISTIEEYLSDLTNQTNENEIN